MPTIYLMLTQTSSALSKTLKCVTRKDYNHISLAMDKELTEVYSFGRLNPNNPFVGGFTYEDVTSDFYRNASCRIYALEITEWDLTNLLFTLNRFKENKDNLHYNFLGLFTAWMKLPWERPNAYFCSEFVSTVLMDAYIMKNHLPASIITPTEIIERVTPILLYEGTLYDYLSLAPAMHRSCKMKLFRHLRAI